jgi:hypothetical protein
LQTISAGAQNIRRLPKLGVSVSGTDAAQKSITGAQSNARLAMMSGVVTRNLMKRAPHLAISVAVLAIPALMVSAILWAVWHWSCYVPVYDEWEWVRWVQRANEGGFWLSDVWAPHNGHRILIPDVIDLLLIQLTHWNRQILMTFNVAVVIVYASLIAWCAALTVRSTRWLNVLIIPFSLLFFTFGSYESWFQPTQLAAFGAVFGVACCMRAYLRQTVSWQSFGLWLRSPADASTKPAARPLSRREFAVALAGAFIASLSFASGLMVWLAFLPHAFAAGYRKFLIWSGLAICTLAVYFYDYRSPIAAGTHLSVLGFVQFVLIFLGAPVGFPNVALSLALGATSLCLFIVMLLVMWKFRVELTRNIVWLGLATFALLTGCVTAYGRLVIGISESIAPRYQVVSILWWIALCMLGVITGRSAVHAARALKSDQNSAPRRRALNGFAVILVIGMLELCVGLLPVQAVGAVDGYEFSTNQRMHQSCVVDYSQSPNACLRIFVLPTTQDPRKKAAYLDRSGLAIFYLLRTGQYSPSVETMGLVRYYDPQVSDHWETIDTKAISPSYHPELQLGLVLLTPQEGTRAIYSCFTLPHDHILSSNSTCQGKSTADLQGYVYQAPPLGIASVPLYVCVLPNDHFVSNHANCDGFGTGQLLGFALAND